jgi:hypothetical protein
VTGTVYNGADTDIVIAGYSSDSAGTQLWTKIYSRTLSSNDVPYSISVGDNGTTVIVSGKSIGTDSIYMVLKYDQAQTFFPADTLLPIQQWAYYENKGQITDTGGHQASYIHYYTNTANPRVYLTDNFLSYVYSSKDSAVDTLQRVDLVFHKSEFGKDPNPAPK